MSFHRGPIQVDGVEEHQEFLVGVSGTVGSENKFHSRIPIQFGDGDGAEDFIAGSIEKTLGKRFHRVAQGIGGGGGWCCG